MPARAFSRVRQPHSILGETLRKIPSLIAGALLVLAVGGYLLPEAPEALPGRILMPNSGGRVLFDHEAHVGNYNIDCQTCHHDASKAGMDGEKCKTCHGLEFDAAFKNHKRDMAKETCAVCHHKTLEKRDWGHANHIAFALPCTACHHPTQLEERPQNCANCHSHRETMGPILALKDAVHTRCASCHTKSFPDSSVEMTLAESMKSCARCHSFAPSRGEDGSTAQATLVPCASCHEEEPARLIPGSMAAYHELCLGCHKKQGGPVETCAQCHRKQ